jgi:predicted nucleic acid binding AN1-type Zn finger protein
MTETKKKKPRCSFEGCNKKLTITDMVCRCGNKYCQLHRVPETHDCSFNFKKMDEEKFMKKCGLGGGEIDKISVI